MATTLLNDDGTASMATMLMSSHHAFRRDIGNFAKALARLARGEASNSEALREEWQFFRGALHGHHEVEDTRMFPSMKAEHPALASAIEKLSADHRHIDPLLEQGDRAFAALPKVTDAAAVVAELKALLDAHLAFEEGSVVPLLRGAKEFPAPQNDAELDMYAQGFAWSTHGLAPKVMEQICVMLPAALVARLPAARAVFAERCVRVWGSAATGASMTSVPQE
jgi:hemerythrin-like domain-containing protein